MQNICLTCKTENLPHTTYLGVLCSTRERFKRYLMVKNNNIKKNARLVRFEEFLKVYDSKVPANQSGLMNNLREQKPKQTLPLGILG